MPSASKLVSPFPFTIPPAAAILLMIARFPGVRTEKGAENCGGKNAKATKHPKSYNKLLDLSSKYEIKKHMVPMT